MILISFPLPIRVLKLDIVENSLWNFMHNFQKFLLKSFHKSNIDLNSQNQIAVKKQSKNLDESK